MPIVVARLRDKGDRFNSDMEFEGTAQLMLKVANPTDHPRCQQHWAASRPHRPAGEMILKTEVFGAKLLIGCQPTTVSAITVLALIPAPESFALGIVRSPCSSVWPYRTCRAHYRKLVVDVMSRGTTGDQLPRHLCGEQGQERAVAPRTCDSQPPCGEL